MPTFTTSFGRPIQFIEGYKAAHPRLTLADIVTPYADMVPDHGTMGIDGFIKDVYEYATMIDFLERHGVQAVWERGLDIGGAEGTISRLFRGEGRLKYAVTIDSSDVRGRLTTAAFVKHYARFKAACAVSRVSPILRRFLVGDAVWRGKRLSSMYNHWGYWPIPSSTFWKLRLRGVPGIDRYIVGDVYKLDEQFDLITAFYCLDYFNIENIFEKVSSLLTEGGTFCFGVNYWWYPVNASGIVGDFPYCCQRLTRDDLRRYFEEFYPEEADDVMRRYDYFHCGAIRPTMSDFVEIASRHNLSLIAAERLAPPRDYHHRSKVTPRLLDQFEDSLLEDVLKDIRQFRPDVGMLDLHTAHAMAAFQKRSKCGGSISESLR